MRHTILKSGHAFILRPISYKDAEEVLHLRCDPILGKYLHATSPNIKDQIKWFDLYFMRENDYYFAVESKEGAIEGFVALYDVDCEKGQAEWGRWLLAPGSFAAVESALLVYRVGFQDLGLNEIYCRTFSLNNKVVSFHDSCGIENRKLLSNYFNLNGKLHDAIEHRVNKQNWSGLESRLDGIARKFAQTIGAL